MTATATEPRPRVANPSPMLARLYAERDQCIAFVDQTIAGANVEGQVRDLSQSEQESLTRTRTRIGEIDAQITPLEEFEQLRNAGAGVGAQYATAGQPAPQTVVTGSLGGAPTQLGTPGRTRPTPHKYATRGAVIVDQLRATPQSQGGQGDQAARDRLLSAGCTFAGATPEQDAAANANAEQIRNALSSDQIRVTQVTGDTPGILPVPIVGDIMSDVDAGRPFISSVGAKPLDFPGETFKRPLVTQHVAVGKQTTQATTTGMGTQKMVIGSVTFTKETWGGYLDVSRQDIDWTSPAAWDALLNDFTEQYGLATENAAADAFVAAAVTNPTIEVAGTGSASTLKDWITALYTAAGTAYTGAGRLPDTIWMSMDVWGILGPLMESQVATNESPGTANIGSFDGNLLKLPRYVVPSMAAGTLIIGNKRWTEVYEQRLGLLQAVLPSVLGVQIAYGGYVAYNTIKAAAFTKVANAT